MMQWVCKTCGYNMIGDKPETCPFCGAHCDCFLEWEQAERNYRVSSRQVNAEITQLLSKPKLGLEHAAYRIETGNTAVWIDCPSVFNRNLSPVSAILFTHLHFMGACNLYRERWKAKVYLHSSDAVHPLAKPFPVDKRFNADFAFHGIAAYHIGGHTPGFTMYIYRDVLFICDYVFSPGPAMCLNPYGPDKPTVKGGKQILDIIEDKPLTTVCGYNYICEFNDWLADFKRLIKQLN